MDFLSNILVWFLILGVTALILLIGASLGNFIVTFCSSITYAAARRKMSVFGYHCFYGNDKSMENDEKCRLIVPILRELYIKGSGFNSYCQRLSDERLPLNIMVNWARSVAEDLFSSPIPSVKLDQWNHYWNSKLYARVSFFHTDFPRYEEHEMGCLWGAVYIWLAINFEKDINDFLMIKISELGCKEKTAVPYFRFFYDAARKIKGKDYYISYTPNWYNEIEEAFSTENYSENIKPEDIYNGFEFLSVTERRNARKMLNDLLAECMAWKMMCNEMKRRGWFTEDVFTPGGTNVHVEGDCFIGPNCHTGGGNVNIGQLLMGDNNTLNYNSEVNKKTKLDGVTLDDMKRAIKECSIYMYASAGITVAFAIGRDLCHWSLSQSEFERKMMGYDCKDGTIANTFRNNPYMREHVSKWATFGARSEVIKLRDELEKSLFGIKENIDTT